MIAQLASLTFCASAWLYVIDRSMLLTQATSSALVAGLLTGSAALIIPIFGRRRAKPSRP